MPTNPHYEKCMDVGELKHQLTQASNHCSGVDVQAMCDGKFYTICKVTNIGDKVIIDFDLC